MIFSVPQKQIPEILGGLAAMLVALPSAIAFGLVIYATLGSEYLSLGVSAGMIGCIAIGLIAPLLGGAPGLVSAPCAPAAAVLAALALQLLQISLDTPTLLLSIAFVGVGAGVLQIIFGLMGGGRLIKYIPYPVVAGYLSSVGIIIILGQINTLLGLPKNIALGSALSDYQNWEIPAYCVGFVSLITLFIAPKITQKIPAPIVALLTGFLTFYGLGQFYPALLELHNNPFVIGSLEKALDKSLLEIATDQWSSLSLLTLEHLKSLFVPILTLAVLLSIDTLKTCVILDALTQNRHNSNKELFAQGVANVGSGLLGGIPGAGTLGATMVNIYGGGKTQLSGFFVGIFSLIAFLFLGSLLAYIPLAALSGILIAVGLKMIDLNSFALLRHKTTWLDFLVIAAVVSTAITFNLMAAAGMGVLLSILLFLRDQVRSSVVRRKTFGNAHFSKRKRTPEHLEILQKFGERTVIFELQGSLFFGTTDQLLNELEPYLKPNQWIILDMKRVHSIDFTAAHLLIQIDARVQKLNGIVCYSNLNTFLYSGQTVQKYLKYLGVLKDHPKQQRFNDLNDALEWAEEKLIVEIDDKTTALTQVPLELIDFSIFQKIPSDIIEKLKSIITLKSFPPHAIIFEQGNAGDELFLIRSGEIKIVLPLENENEYHLTTFLRGDFFGDMAFLDNQPRSAKAITKTTTELFVLSRQTFDILAKTEPLLSSRFFSKIALCLALRLRQADTELRALEAG